MRKIKKHLTGGFTLMEILIVMVIIGILVTVSVSSFMGSQKKSRDARRKSDLKQIGIALEAYFNDKRQYPLSSSDQIAGCEDEAVCGWDEAWEDENGTVYMVELPGDRTAGANYVYASTDGTSYQLYARLENAEDLDVPKDNDDNPQVYDGLDCGSGECNYGISSSNTTPEEGRTLVTE